MPPVWNAPQMLQTHEFAVIGSEPVDGLPNLPHLVETSDVGRPRDDSGDVIPSSEPFDNVHGA